MASVLAASFCLLHGCLHASQVPPRRRINSAEPSRVPTAGRRSAACPAPDHASGQRCPSACILESLACLRWPCGGAAFQLSCQMNDRRTAHVRSRSLERRCNKTKGTPEARPSPSGINQARFHVTPTAACSMWIRAGASRRPSRFRLHTRPRCTICRIVASPRGYELIRYFLVWSPCLASLARST